MYLLDLLKNLQETTLFNIFVAVFYDINIYVAVFWNRLVERLQLWDIYHMKILMSDMKLCYQYKNSWYITGEFIESVSLICQKLNICAAFVV